MIKFPHMKIYTKTGDKGKTGVIGGRLKKNSIIIESIGTFDELNASIGIVIASNQKTDLFINELVKVQNIIFCIGSILSGVDIEVDLKQRTKSLENLIDEMNSKLEELTRFILPGGSLTSAHIHLCRTICRRAERRLLEYIDSFEKEKPNQMAVNRDKLDDAEKFINRLSDYLFVLARYINSINNIPDVYWNKTID